MKLKQLFKEDDAVSPVIGVILMVAITVILAAVIASFVLGLGDTADEVQPTSTFSFDTEPGDELTITLSDGDTVEAEEIIVRGTDAFGSDSPLDSGDEGESINDVSGDIGDETWDVGQSVSLSLEDDIDSDAEIRLIWEELDGDNSATLATHEISEYTT